MLTRLHIVWSFAYWNMHFRLKFYTYTYNVLYVHICETSTTKRLLQILPSK